ncbi:MAG TPA: IS66 family insertion sequence element accessory protein TnpB, partial [Gemmataceae bacterium]|nr:IS66 family insertion sequence element accessory protein TnpB [Gemmataceae bacterium]
MLSLSLPGRVFLCTLATDMRKSFDSLAGLVRQHLDQDPLVSSGQTVSHYRGRKGCWPLLGDGGQKLKLEGVDA